MITASTWGVFFGWPNGGVWSNMIAWLLGLIVGAGCAWAFRDHLGRWLARWWHAHHGQHLAAEIKCHVEDLLSDHTDQIANHLRAELGKHHEALKDHITREAGNG